MALVTRIITPSTRTIVWAYLRKSRSTLCAVCGSPRKKRSATIYGFANEGLWPLCHIAHTRPVFRTEDWEAYREVNRKFAEALLEEMAGAEHPIVLVQDYHFALLPKLIKDQRPDVRVAIFWHIPGRIRKRSESVHGGTTLLEGLLGADLIGFHIQSHWQQFLRDHRSYTRVAHRVGTVCCQQRRPTSPVCVLSHQRWILRKLRSATKPTDSNRGRSALT